MTSEPPSAPIPKVTTTNCTCAKKKVSWSRRHGPLRTQYTSTTFRVQTCPYRLAQSSFLFQVNMTPFVNRTMEVLLSTRHGAGGSTISQTLRTYHTVSRQYSPAFPLFEELSGLLAGAGFYSELFIFVQKHEEKLAKTVVRSGITTTISTSEETLTATYCASLAMEMGREAVSSWVRSIPQRLDVLFATGAARPTNKDEFGNYLLHVSGFGTLLTSTLFLYVSSCAHLNFQLIHP